MSRNSLFASSFLFVASFALLQSAKAAPLVSIGDNADVYFNGSTSLQWTSNLFRDEDDEEDDVVWMISPGFEVNVGRGLANADLSIITRYDIRRYFDNDDLDVELFSIKAIGSYRSSRLDLNGSAGFSEQKSGTGGRDIQDLIESDNINGSINAEYRVSPKFSFGAGFNYREKDYVTYEEFFADRETFQIPLDLFYELTPKVDLSVGYTYSETDVGALPAIVAPFPFGRPARAAYTTEDHFINIGARGNLLPKLTGFFKVGYKIRDDDRSGSSSRSTLGVDADFTWAVTPKFTARLGLSRDFGVGEEGESTENTSANLSANYSLNSYFALTGFGSYTIRDYEDGRDDNQYEFGARLTYRPIRYWRFSAGYTYSENDSDAFDRSYVDHSIDISASLRY